ncbi:MAG: type II secretion system protein [Candidatus Cloacimonetes bacterium]|nr:type II secretion system protein [Candidatus Cloacimonadota bacterium]MBT6993368.1 type II secretion system protein [Candidatus Cloacimonadota bacterium]
MIKKEGKFSLIELLMIIMIVGIVLTLIIPLRADRMNKKKLSEAVRNVQIIARADAEFEAENGYFIFEHSVMKFGENKEYSGDDLLNIKDKLQKFSDDFLFDYTVTDSTVVATSNKNFGKKGASIYYFLPNGPFGLNKDKISKNIFDPNWLP